jgi:hypothetical protein
MTLLLSASVFAQTATQPSGTGTSGDPYLIASWQNLYWISQNSSSWDKYFEQTADIDLSAASPDITTWDSGSGWTPIAFDPTNTKSQQFFGNYNGKGHFVSGLYINRPNSSNVGLFSHLGYDEDSVAIRNLTLKDVTIIGGRGTGSLVGRVTGNNKNLIELCSSVDGNVTGDGATGGLVGSHNSYVENPSNRNNHPVLRKCYANINVSWSREVDSGADKFGGLTGCNQKGMIINSHARGVVTVDNDPAVEVLNPQDNLTVPSRIGGLSGCILIRGYVEDSYSSSIVTTYGSVSSVGGFVGKGGTGGGDGETFDCFWDTETSGQATSSPNSGCTGKTTSEMKTLSTYTGAGWDFTNTWEMIGTNYPRLQENPDASLPVTLTDFTAKTVKGAVVLEWITSAEIENQGFILSRKLKVESQKSEVTASFVTHDALKGQGSTTETTKYLYVDKTVEHGKTYVYTLADVDYSGNESILKKVEVQVKTEETIVAEGYVLDPVYPNPFNATLTVPFTLSEPMHVSIDLYSLTGRHVLTAVNREFTIGSYLYTIKTPDLSSGIYLIQTSFGGKKKYLQKAILLK